MLSIIQIIVSVILIVLIMLQERSSGAGGMFGGGGGGEFYQTRRGLERGLFITTIIFVALFASTAFLNLVLPLS